MEANPADCARAVLDVIPAAMRSLRAEFRRHRGSDLNIPQFRVLMFLRRSPGRPLADVAEHLGITPPSTSRLVDGLVARGLIDRQESLADRRRVALALTPAGEALAETALGATQAVYTARFAALPPETLAVISQAMDALRDLFCEDSAI